MDTQALQAEVRSESGKGPARQLRMRGLIPSVFYGPGVSPTSIAVPPKDLRRVLSTAHGRNAVIELALGAKKELALVRDVQIDPLSREPIHADFYRVELGRPVEVLVPFVPTGKSVGVVEGGVLNIVYRMLPVRTTPDRIPLKIEADITALNIGDGLRVNQVQLPPGVTIALPQERTIVSITTEDKRGEEEAAAAPVAAAAAAAPAAGAKADAKKPEAKKADAKK